MGIHERKKLDKKDESFRDWSNIDDTERYSDYKQPVGNICKFLGSLFDKICGRKHKKKKNKNNLTKKSKGTGRISSSNSSRIRCSSDRRIGQEERRH